MKRTSYVTAMLLLIAAALLPAPAQAVVHVGGQGWFSYTGDQTVSYPFVAGATYTPGSNPWASQPLIDMGTYNTIRFMDWGCTNNNSNVAWGDRKLPSNTDQSGPWNPNEWQWAPPNNWTDTGTPNPKGLGMAYEWMVDLCNRTNTNMWVCIPDQVNDDYVTKLAQLIRFGSNGTTPYTSTQGSPVFAPLNSSLKIYVEYSNEVWNAGFDQYHRAMQLGIAQGLGDNLHYYGRRTAQIGKIFTSIWTGSTSRLVRVLGAQCVNSTWVEDNEIAQVQADGGAIDAVAVAPYWDVGDGSSSSYLSNATTAINGQLANLDVHKTWANSHGVSLVCYEGGMACGTNADQARRNANNLSLYQTFLDGCNTHGVDLINLYAHVGTPGTSNAWGAKEFWAQATSAAPSWNGTVTWITNHPGSGNGGGGGSVPGAPGTLTAGAGNSQVALSWGAASGATSYTVYRSTASGSETSLVTGVATTSYTNTGLTNGTTYYYKVAGVDSTGTGSQSNEASATPVAGSSGLVKINTGGPAASPFVADTDFSGGTTATNWTGTIDTSAVTSPAPQAVYQSERYGSPAMTYTMPGLTSGTTYQVRLHFCENYFTTSAQRVFSVAINGTTVLTNFDIFATAGAIHKANIQQFNAAANGSGQIVVAFTNVTNNALVNGIEINAAGGSPPAAPTGLTPTAGNTQVTLNWTASSGATAYDLKRSTTSGSGYVTVASPVTTNFTNTGLTNGTTYYFVVDAKNASGASGNSAQVSSVPTSGGGTFTLNPTADRDNQSDNAAGTNPNINVSQWDNPAYKFSLTGVTGTISSAKLRIYRNDVVQGSGIFNAHQAVDTWTENGTIPALGTTITSVTNNAVGYIEFTVTSYVTGEYNGDKTVSFVLDNNLGGWTGITARESTTNKPQLVIVSN